MRHTMNLSPFVTLTVILRAPVTEPGRSRRWSAHCLDLNLGVSAGTASAVRMRLASSVAAHVSLGLMLTSSRAVDSALWEEAGAAPLVTHQVVETDVGAVAIRYVQPGVALPN